LQDVNIAGQVVHVRYGKGGKDRIVPIGKVTAIGIDDRSKRTSNDTRMSLQKIILCSSRCQEDE